MQQLEFLVEPRNINILHLLLTFILIRILGHVNTFFKTNWTLKHVHVLSWLEIWTVVKSQATEETQFTHQTLTFQNQTHTKKDYETIYFQQPFICTYTSADENQRFWHSAPDFYTVSVSLEILHNRYEDGSNNDPVHEMTVNLTFKITLL